MSKFRFSQKPNMADKINWHNWKKETFQKAKKQNKLIYLSLTATWCHWCHIMDETSLSFKPTIDYLNKNLISIRIDTDMRPDIQNRYVMGGWPTNAFLTYEGDIIDGKTYVPAEEFFKILTNINNNWTKNGSLLLKEAAKRREEFKKTTKQLKPSKPSLSYVDSVIEEYKEVFDSLFGGFGTAMKFPSPLTLELFMQEAINRGDSSLLDFATLTLDKMAKGEIYDKEWGGFFRYATERDWSKPHYEKILSDNAQIIMNYLHAYEINKNKLFKDVASKSLEFINTYLANHSISTFYASQDADEVFYQKEASKREAENLPFVDKNVYTDASSIMISTYLEAYRILGDKKYTIFALDALRFLLANNLSSIGAAHYFNKEDGPSIIGLLSDQVWLLNALINAYDINPQVDYLTYADGIIDILVNRLAGNGTFFDKPEEESDIGNMQIRYFPAKENSLLAIALKRFGVLTNNMDFLDMANKIIASISYNDVKGDYVSMAPYALAISEVLEGPAQKAA